jgi:hypothetical protein
LINQNLNKQQTRLNFGTSSSSSSNTTSGVEPLVSSAADLHYCPITQFIGDLLKLLTCQNDKFGFQVQRHIQDLLGHELNTLCYPILFEQIKLIVDKFFDSSGQVCVNEQNTLFIENIIFIMKCVLDNDSNGNGSSSAGSSNTSNENTTVNGVTTQGPANNGNGVSAAANNNSNSAGNSSSGSNSSTNNNSADSGAGSGNGQQDNALSTVSVENLMINIVKYVRHLDSSVQIIQIKTKVCQLVEAVMKRREDLLFRQEMKFRNKLVEYLTDWIMGNSHQFSSSHHVQSMNELTASLNRDLDQASMQATAALLSGLPLQPEENDKGDLMEAKSQLFLKYFTLFMNLLNDCSEDDYLTDHQVMV